MTPLSPTIARAGIAVLVASALASSVTVTLKPLVDMPLPIRPDDIAIAGDRAYLVGDGDCGESDGLRVVDLADASAPVVRGFVCPEDPPLPLWSVAAEGTIAVARTSSSSLFVIDAADPDAPRVASRITDVPGAIEEVRFLDGTRLALRFSEYEHQPVGLVLVDLTDATAPVVASRLALPERSGSDSSDTLAVYGSVIYTLEDELRIVRATAEGELEQIGAVPIPTRHGWNMRLSVDAAQQRLYVVDVDARRLWAYDVRRPEAPMLLASGVSLPIPANHFGPREVIVADGLALVVTGEGGGATREALVVLDVSDPRRPREAGSVASLKSRGMAVSQAGELLFVGFEDYTLPDGTRASRGRLFGFTPEIVRRWLAWLPALVVRDELAP